MGIIKAFTSAVAGGFADTWEEVIEPQNIGDQTVYARGVLTRKGQNTKGTDNIVSNGSIIHVYDNQFMILVDGGKIVDYTAEPGYYQVSNSSMPSLFNGQFGDSLKEAFNRIKFGGQTPQSQKVYYINLQEIKGIKFGTRNPINYFDTFYNAELFLRAHGTYSIKITNPLQFYAEAIPKNMDHVEITDINEQYMSEFLGALQSAINQMSADGIRISFVTSKAQELGQYMANCLDESWNQQRGMEVQNVGIASLSYDEKSQELINTRNEGAMLSDPTVAQGYMVKNMSEGVKAAGSNSAGAMTGFMGVGLGVNAMGNMMGGLNQMGQNVQQQMQNPYQQPMGNPYQQPMGNPYQQPQQGYQQPQQPQQGYQQPQQGYQQPQQAYQQPQQPQAGAVVGAGMVGNTAPADTAPAAPAAGTWTCECGNVNTGKFCSECGKPMPAPAPAEPAEWTCSCGTVNTGKFCCECGKPRA